MGSVGIILSAIFAAILFFLFIHLLIRLIKWVSRGNVKVERALFGLFIAFLLYPLLITTYPSSTTTISTDSGSVTYNPKKAETLIYINRWEKLPSYGYIYLKKVDNFDNKGLRLYFRTAGFNTKGPWDLEGRPELKDSEGNKYISGGGGLQSGVLLSSGTMDFFPVGKIGSNLVLRIDGKNIQLQK